MLRTVHFCFVKTNFGLWYACMCGVCCEAFLMLAAIFSNPVGLLWPYHDYVELAYDGDFDARTYIFMIAALGIQTLMLAFYGAILTKTTRCLAELVESVHEIGMLCCVMFYVFVYLCVCVYVCMSMIGVVFVF